MSSQQNSRSPIVYIIVFIHIITQTYLITQYIRDSPVRLKIKIRVIVKKAENVYRVVDRDLRGLDSQVITTRIVKPLHNLNLLWVHTFLTPHILTLNPT